MSATFELNKEHLEEIDPRNLGSEVPGACDPTSTTLNGLVLKEGNLFLLTDERGNVSRLAASQLGLFHEDTRYLNHWELQVLGHEPQVLSSQANRVFCNQIDLTTTRHEVGKDIYEHNFIHIRRRQVLSGKMVERLRISNYLNIAQRITLSVNFAADFADMFEVRGMERELRGIYYKPVIDGQTVLLCYRGRDDVLRATRIHFGEKPKVLNESSAVFELAIPAHGTFLIEMHITPLVDELTHNDEVASYTDLYTTTSESYERWRSHCTSIESDHEFLASSLAQSITDLRALIVEYHDQSIVSAGIPWYSTPFGRDSLITSLQTLPINPDIARSTLLFLARYQGEKVDDFTAEEPGKIMHEIRRGEMAQCGEIPHVPYYGTVDATPLFVILLHEYFLWTNDEPLVRQLLPNAERALRWMDEYGDVDGDGLVEYWKFTERGILHQGWKDSVDGVSFPDGTQPNLPIALIEVQGYVLDAKARMSKLYRTLGMPEESKRLRAEASRLQEKIDQKFWMRQERFYALGLDGKKRIIPTITSNPTHLLYSRAVSQTNAGRITRRVMGNDMFSGWGIRTLSSEHPVYNPLSYHNGSVWPHDNAVAVLGMCNYNQKDAAERVFISQFESCMHFQYYRLPELFCGMARQANDSPVHYPVACSPQAWAAASFFMMLQGLIGIRPDAPQRRLYIECPRLPSVARDLTIRNMRIGNSRISLQITRDGERTFVNVLEQSGEPVRVTIEWN